MNNHIWFDVMGWTGAAVLLAAYAMVSSKRWEGDSTFYQILNIVGSVLLAANTIVYGAYPSTFVNMIWIGIAVFTIVRRESKYSR